MKITLANKKLLTKPLTNLEKGIYFKDLKFKTGNFSLTTLKKIIENGCTITYIYNDDEFTRTANYTKTNYKGTQYIVVDVDKCDISPLDFVESLKYKPTIIHTTFSNKTALKENKWCFHLIYMFDSIIYGEENFKKVFEELTADYMTYVDAAAKDCHRVIFTTNSTLPNYIYKEYGDIYKVEDFISESATDSYDDLEGFFDENSTVAKNENAHILTTTNNIQANEKNATIEKNTLNNTNAFGLDADFFNDLNQLNRSVFLNKYSSIYPIINRTMPHDEQIKVTKDGITYEDWRYNNYYEVPSKYRYNADLGKRQVVKVPNGQRTKSLMFDCICFIKCNPDITKECLVYELVNEVYKYYDNSDKEMNNYKIVGVAKYGWQMKDDIKIEPMKKKFKIVTAMNMKKCNAVGLLNKLMKDEEIGENIDLQMSLEDNIKAMKENGFKITKKRLVQFCNEYEIELLSDKEIRNKKVMDLHNENPSLSLRKLQDLCKEKGINIDYSTIQRII